MKIEERMNEIAQAYCTERNSHKVMDSDLMLDAKEIAIRIAKEYAEESRWINVGKRLPQMTKTQWSHDVLCINKNGHQWVDCLFFNENEAPLFWLSRSKEATHWQPLPSPPIATEEGGE